MTSFMIETNDKFTVMQICSLNSLVENVIAHSTQCPFYMIYCTKCDISYNGIVGEHKCAIQNGNLIIFQPKQVRLTNLQLTTYEEGDVILYPLYLTDSLENFNKIRFKNFISVARISSTPFLFNSNAPLSGRPIKFLPDSME